MDCEFRDFTGMSDSSRSSPAHSCKNYDFELFDEVPTVPDQTVIEGWLKFRDQKKVKNRYVFVVIYGQSGEQEGACFVTKFIFITF